MLGDVQNLRRGKKKIREKARLEICSFCGLKEIRKFVYPHSSFTCGLVKILVFKKATHQLPTHNYNFMFVLKFVWAVYPTKKIKRKPRVRIKRKTFTDKCDQGRI